MPFDFNEELASRADVSPARASLAESATRALLAGTPVFVDVGSRKIESHIERDGVPIGVLKLDPELLKDHILDKPVLRVKVVQQSIAPGTPVPVGSTVDLVVAPPFDLPLGVITGVHQGLAQTTIGDTFAKVKDNPLVNRIVARAVAGQLAPEDAIAVREIFTALNVEITDQPGTDVNAAVETLKALKTFGA